MPSSELDAAPCGLLSTDERGTIVEVNSTFCEWTGHDRDALVDRRRFQDLLTGGGRIYHETHVAPLLRMQGAVREIAVELVRVDGQRLPVLVNSTLDGDRVHTAVFTASDRRAYEQELLRLRNRAEELAAENARLYERERGVAETLQRSMLESPVPDDPRLALATFYKPGTEQLEVGGDWHDAFAIGPDRVGLVVGDVVGRGLEAASAMGRLRSATRALALAGLGPSGVLEHLDAFVEQIPTARSATLAFVEVDLATGAASLACAGHPPPILAGPGATPVLLWEGRSAPLGAYRTGMTRPAFDLVLEPGSRLLLYTDGAVERRDRRIDDGILRLVDLVAAGADGPVAATVDWIAREVEGIDDDVCLLAFALLGPAHG